MSPFMHQSNPTAPSSQLPTPPPSPATAGHLPPLLVHPQAFDVHVVSYILMKLSMEDFTGNTSRLVHL